MNTCILVVDDEPAIADLLELYLKNETYTVLKFYTGTQALEAVENEEIDLAIIDIMLPDIDGFAVCRQIRQHHQYPIIMLTAKGEEIDKITGLTMGADDYVTKPFKPLELIARVKAQLRRYHHYQPKDKQNAENLLSCGELTINPDTHEAAVAGQQLQVTPTEFGILRILCERKGQVVSAEELFQAIWEDEYYSKANNTITVHIRHLRKKLDELGENGDVIKTVWGVGYKIEC